MSLSDTILTTRNATVADLVSLLQAQHAAKLDIVVPARHLSTVGDNLRLAGVGEPRLTPDGVSPGETLLRPTAIADNGIADKLAIPVHYLPVQCCGPPVTLGPPGDAQQSDELLGAGLLLGVEIAVEPRPECHVDHDRGQRGRGISADEES